MTAPAGPSSKTRLLVSWSSGKDSAWTLHRLRQDDSVEVAGLMTTINASAGRVAMHAVREILLERQAAAAGLPLIKISIPYPCPNEVYEAAMRDAMTAAAEDGITAVAFGDLFLEDIRRYREEKMALTDLKPVFPIWGQDTAALAREMVAAGLQAHVTCVDPKQLGPAFAGRAFDNAFLDDLPPGVDPCGENGEFHSFVHAGPIFDAPIPITPGEIVERDGFVFADILPA